MKKYRNQRLVDTRYQETYNWELVCAIVTAVLVAGASWLYVHPYVFQ